MENNVTKIQNDWDKIQKVKNNLFKDVNINNLIKLRDTVESDNISMKIQEMINIISDAMNTVNDELERLQKYLHDLEMKEYTKDWTAQEWAEYHMSCNNID